MENTVVEKEGYSIHQSSSSHASDTDRVADLCDLTRGQDTFTGSQIVLEGDRRVSIGGEPGSGDERQFSPNLKRMIVMARCEG